MERRSREEPFACPIEVTLSVIGGKWKSVILFHVVEGVQRFGERRRRIPGFTQKMLTQQLRELEADGAIRRKVYAEVPPRAEYSLTPYGRTLRPVLQAMCKWGKAHAGRAQGGATGG